MTDPGNSQSPPARRLPAPELPALEGWVTIKEAARQLGLSRSAVRNHVRAGRLGPMRRVGTARVDLLPLASVEAFRGAGGRDPDPPSPVPSRSREADRRLVRVFVPQSLYQEAAYFSRHSGVAFNDYFVWALRHLADCHDRSVSQLTDAWRQAADQEAPAGLV